MSRRRESVFSSVATASVVLIATHLEAQAQQAAQPAPLPQITVEANKKKKAAAPAKKKAAPAVAKAKAQPAPQPAPEPDVGILPSDGTAAGGPAADAQGDIGYNATRTSTATKTDTPLRNVPQSISVITDKQIKDQNIKSIGEATKYVPGVTTGTGEGNRDQISIRGQNTTADFFVDGVRDDAQIFRDLYNAERIEVLKGPNALIFGRGGGGGIINRVTKKADFFNRSEGTVSVGSYGYKRAQADSNYVINPNFAVRMNAMYENSDSFRDYVDLERWAVNPTFTFRLSDRTKVMVGYEHLEDHRTADRGHPSIANQRPFSQASRSTFFGHPDLSYADAAVDSVFATVEHKTDFGLKIRNHSYYANYDKFYQNVYPSNPVNFTNDTVTLAAYNQENDRENYFNQTDLTYKLDMGITRHTLMAGAEFGRQKSRNLRDDGMFSRGLNCSGTSCTVPLSDPTIFGGGIDFVHTSGVDNNVKADVQSFYIQDQLEITRYLELIAGVRHDSFDIAIDDHNSNILFENEDNLISPRAGIILKPTEALSVYGSYTVSYLPFSGDQFSALNVNTVDLKAEKFTNYEVGLKWDITPALSFAVAHYWLERENSLFRDANNNYLQTGKSEVEGTEVTLTGYVTDRWEIAAGYANQDGETATDTRTGNSFPNDVIPAGTDLPFLPEHTFSLWNRYQVSSMWGVGLGVVHRTDMLVQLSAVQTVLPEYTTVDAALYFRLNEHLKAQLNVENILGEDYYLTGHNNNNLAPGAPTTAYVSVTSSF